MQVENINLEITDACNLRCAMCDIWKEKHNSYFSIDMVNNIFESTAVSKNVDITLTGGELFLHPELYEITEKINCLRPKKIKTISTNGFLSNELLAFIENFRKDLSNEFSVHISLDGINLHDKQRGLKSKDTILNTIKLLKTEFKGIPISIKFTITTVNCTDIWDTYQFCKNNGLKFKPKIVEYAPNYTNRESNREFHFNHNQKLQIKNDLLKVNKELNSLFITDSIKYLYNINAPHYCLTPFNRAFVMASGEVYSCIHFDRIGNINEEPFENIWNSAAANHHRAQIDRENCRKCVSYHGGKDISIGAQKMRG